MSARSDRGAGSGVDARRPRQAARAAAGALAMVLTLAGCAVGPDFIRPGAPAVTRYTPGTQPAVTPAAQGVSQRLVSGASVSADWWRLFGSTELDAAVGQALAQNPGLQAAEQSLRASQDTLRAGYGIFFPQAQADASASRQRYTPVKLGQRAAASIFNLFSLSGAVGYTLDPFGAERRRIEGLGAQADLQRATQRAAYLALTANVVDTIIARAAYRAEVRATLQLIALQRRQVGLAEVQVRAGIAPYSSVLGLRSQLATYEAAVPILEQRVAQSDDLLATLCGRVPARWQAPEVRLADLALPRDLPVSLPSSLVRQRPDILEAEAAAHAASANVGVATAALLPSVTLSGAYGANGTSTWGLLAAGGRSWSAGADVAAPLFEGGTLWFQRKAAIDAYRQAMALYRQTVINAFGQVSDSLLALQHDAQALAAYDEALADARQALQLVQANYQAGLSSYLEVLTADVQYHQAQINDLQAIAVRYQDTVALYVALGGGWWNAAPENEAGP